MTFSELRRRTYRGIQRDDLLPDMPAFVNEARREIQDRRSWECMRDSVDILVPAGNNIAALPAHFKELVKPQPVYLVADDGGLVPVPVVDEGRARQRAYALTGLLVTLPQVALETAPVPCLRFLAPLEQSLTFRVQFYGYLPALVQDADACRLAAKWPRMVIALARANAFAEINDPAATDNRAEYEVLYRMAAAADAYSAVAGKTQRM